jgi:rubrerythrin
VGSTSTYQVFEEAERVELLSAAIYGALAERFTGDRDARALFPRLQEEEIQHASRVRLLAARYRHDSKLLERVASESRNLRPLIDECEAILAAVKDGSWGRDLDEVTRNLAALEERFCRAHADLIAREGHPELRVFFIQLARQDEAHGRVLARSSSDENPKDRSEARHLR